MFFIHSQPFNEKFIFSGKRVSQLQATFIDAVCVLLCVAGSSFHRRRQSVMVHAALLSLDRQREMRYLHHYATTNSLPCHFVAS